MIDEYIKFTDFYSDGTAWNRRTDTNWHLIPLTKIIVAPPALKTSYVNYEYASGSYDATTMNGLNFANRVGKWQFKLMPEYDFDQIRFKIAEWLHGGYFKIEISSETDGCYYLGRVMLDEWRSTDRGNYITLSYIIDPFAIDPSNSIPNETITITPDNPITKELRTTRMPSNPYIYIKSVTGTLTIKYPVVNLNGPTYYDYAHPLNVNLDGTWTVTTKDKSRDERYITNILIFRSIGGIGFRQVKVPIVFSVSEGGSATVEFQYTGGRL